MSGGQLSIAGEGQVEERSARVRVYNHEQCGTVEGLVYHADFLSPEAERELLRRIDEQDWSAELKRRVQHYGYRYDYKARRVDSSMHLGPLPPWLAELAGRLAVEGIVAGTPDQVIVNEYLPGQGISAHVDCEPCFDDGIVSITLGSGCVMNFTRPGEKGVVALYLEPRSLVALHGPARYEWRHSIAARKSDVVAGESIPRARRVSLTFRKVVLERERR